jgi:hypothetical protein
MSSIVISGDSSGQVSLTVPSAAGTNTATLPAATGTVMVSGNMPAFSAYQSSTQSLSSGILTKVQFQTKEFDTNSYYDNTTNYRFTPLVAGYYQISACCNSGNATSTALSFGSIYKNGSRFKDFTGAAATINGSITNGSALIYLNGSTDYVEFYMYQASGGTTTTISGASSTYFQAVLVRN